MGGLVLIVNHDGEARRKLRRRLDERGYEAVEAASVAAALELIQRLPRSFRLVVVRLDMPGLSGATMIETLRLFHPAIPVLGTGSREGTAVAIGCPELVDGIEERLHSVAGESGDGAAHFRLPFEVAQRARERYQRTADLVEAAQIVATAVPPV